MGLCPICIEPQHRGGEGKKVWLSMKFSAFKWSVVIPSLFVVPLMRCPSQSAIPPRREYRLISFSYHMQFYHGAFDWLGYICIHIPHRYLGVHWASTVAADRLPRGHPPSA
jgi:hypothetical protein